MTVNPPQDCAACVQRITVLEAKIDALEVLLNNQANILKWVVTPLIVIVGAVAGVNLIG